MKFLPSLLAFLPLTLGLMACGPVYKTNYDLLPPATEAGRLCSQNVRAMSDTCLANCQMMARNCQNRSSVGFGYGTGPHGHGGAFGGGFSQPLTDDRDCSAAQCEDNCMNAARQGHINCGGDVKESLVCVSNCPAAAAPAPLTP